MKELMAIQQELRAPKSQFNTFGKYKYRSCEDILEAVKPLLLKYKCTLTLSDEIKYYPIKRSVETKELTVTKDNEKTTLASSEGLVYVEATAVLSSGETYIKTTAHAGIDTNKKGMDISQSFGSSSSYARKYALNGLFCIDDNKDADATNTHSVDTESLERKLKAELDKYTDPQKLDHDKVKLKEKYVKLGLDKKVAVDIIVGALNAY